MAMPPQIARDISYAHAAQSRAGRALIRTMETLTGRIALIKRADGYEHDLAAGGDFWSVMAARYGVSLNVVAGQIEAIPREGPLVLIANHPFGILDGLMMGHILNQRRDAFRILANSVFRKAADLNEVVLPVSFEQTKAAVQMNLLTRRNAMGCLAQGGAIGIFPGGTVSTAARPFSKPMDPSWRSFSARMISKSEATVVPVFFDGACSRLFQIASHLHSNLRMGLLIKEFGARVDAPVDVVIGAPISAASLDPFKGDSKSLMEFLRRKTYELSPTPLNAEARGFEF